MRRPNRPITGNAQPKLEFEWLNVGSDGCVGEGGLLEQGHEVLLILL